MYEPDGTETLVRVRVTKDLGWVGIGEHQIAVDQEVHAHFLNHPEIEVVEEVMIFSRLNPDDYEWLQTIPKPQGEEVA